MKKYSILLVDDEQEFLSLITELLTGDGYEVTTALNGKIAIDLLKTDTDFAVILSDEKMPEMMGTDFLDQAKTLSPESSRVMITAYSNIETMQKAINAGEVYKFLTKPVKIDELQSVVKAGVERYEKEKKASYLSKLFDQAQNKIGQITKQLKLLRQERDQAEQSTTLLKDSIEKKDKYIFDLAASLKKLQEKEENSKTSVDDPELFRQISEYEERFRDINDQAQKDANVKSRLKGEISELAAEYESLESEGGSLFLRDQWHFRFLEVREFLLKMEADLERLASEQDEIIAFYGNTLYENMRPEKEGKLSYQTALNIQSSLETTLQKKESTLNDLNEFRKLDLYLGKNIKSFVDLEESAESGFPEDAEPEPQGMSTSRGMESFLIPYSDMMTILLAFFILIVAISNVNNEKFTGYLTYFQGRGDVPKGSNVYLTSEEMEMLDKVKKLVQDNVDPDSIRRGDVIKVRLDSELLFEPGEADLLPEAGLIILDSIEPHFSLGVKQILIEGHTDDVPVATKRYPSNWELSSARASSVARLIIDQLKYPSQFIKVIGYASFRPLRPNNSDDNRRMNRRVEITILKPQEK